MDNNFFEELEKNSTETRKNVTQKQYNQTEDSYIDAIILSAILPIYGLLIYVIHIGGNKFLARRCLLASVIAIGVYILIMVFILAINS